MPRLCVIFALIACVLPGCILPRTKIVKNPKDNDTGLRFYRPKPYLMVKPMTNKDGVPVSGFVTMETKMLPDFAEEYSVHVRPGIGVNETEITLSEGWNLTALNVKVDSQIDENIEAAAELVKSKSERRGGGLGDLVRLGETCDVTKADPERIVIVVHPVGVGRLHETRIAVEGPRRQPSRHEIPPSWRLAPLPSGEKIRDSGSHRQWVTAQPSSTTSTPAG